jgi:hypothetical protein
VPITKPAPVATVPVVVAMQSSSDANVQQDFVAVKSASAEATPAQPTSSTAPSVGTTAASAPAPAAQSNLIQTIFSDPKTVANDFYLFLMAVFLLALVLNIFINIRVQYPRLIAGGLLVIVVAGLCIILNQNIGFLHTVIL